MQVKSTFVCPRCGRQTLHELHYAGHVLHEIRCTECDRVIYAHHHPLAAYLLEWRGRLATKPLRVYREISIDPARVFTLFRRTVSKPTRVAREIREVLH